MSKAHIVFDHDVYREEVLDEIKQHPLYDLMEFRPAVEGETVMGRDGREYPVLNGSKSGSPILVLPPPGRWVECRIGIGEDDPIYWIRRDVLEDEKYARSRKEKSDAKD